MYYYIWHYADGSYSPPYSTPEIALGNVDPFKRGIGTQDPELDHTLSLREALG